MIQNSTVLVVGAGAWGLPSALQLQDRGYSVTLVDRFAPGSGYASNGGSTRLWRLADTQIWRSRAMLGTLSAMERLSTRLDQQVFRRTGMIWRDDLSLSATSEALTSIGQSYEYVESEDVGEYFPGLRPDGRDALFVNEAGIVHADRLLHGALEAFVDAGGQYLPHSRVTSIDPGSESVSIRVDSGETLHADQLLLTAGPGTPELLPGLDMRLPLRAYIEQVVYFGNDGAKPPAPDLPALVDCAAGDGPGMYAMPNGLQGYKAGTDHPLRALENGMLGEDLDRTASPERTEAIRARVERDLTAVPPHVLATQVCTWTDTPDGDFIIGRTHPTVVIACGDSGEGFKYSAFMGEYLADLVDRDESDAEFQKYWDPARFGDTIDQPHTVSSIGRH